MCYQVLNLWELRFIEKRARWESTTPCLRRCIFWPDDACNHRVAQTPEQLCVIFKILKSWSFFLTDTSGLSHKISHGWLKNYWKITEAFQTNRHLNIILRPLGSKKEICETLYALYFS